MKKRRSVEKKGVLYLGHLPFGFYGTALQKYFRQFGRIKKVRVERSRKSGRYKGYAFIEFANEEVAKIAAEATDNYILNRKVLRAKFIPADEMKGALLKKRKVYPYQRKCVKKTSLCAAIGLSERSLIKKQAKFLKLHQKLADYGVTNYELLPVNLDNLEKRIEESKDRKERLRKHRETAKEDIQKSRFQENVVTRILRGRKSPAAKLKAKAKRLREAKKKPHAKKLRVTKKRTKTTKAKKKREPMKPMNKRIDTFERALDDLRESLNKSTTDTSQRNKAPQVETGKESRTKSSATTNNKTQEKVEVKKYKRKFTETSNENELYENEPKSKQKHASKAESLNTSQDRAAASKASGKDRLKSFRHKAQNIHYKYIS